VRLTGESLVIGAKMFRAGIFKNLDFRFIIVVAERRDLFKKLQNYKLKILDSVN